MTQVDILLATYNGARFIAEQLDSLAAQTMDDWRLLVRDDGSDDGTLDIVRDWAARSGRDVVVVEDTRGGLGPAQNFAALMDISTAPYFAFCDQDDVWLPEKLALLLDRMRAEEARAGAGVPVLAFSDLHVVDGALCPTGQTFWQMSRVATDPHGQSLLQAMLRSSATGCATLGNAALRAASLPIAAEARMHDWWVALVAQALGRCVAVPQPTVLYRVHGGNVMGVGDAGLLPMLALALRKPAATLRRAIAARDTSRAQARAFAQGYGERIEPSQAQALRDYGALAGCGWWQRKTFVLRHGLGRGSPLFRIALVLVS